MRNLLALLLSLPLALVAQAPAGGTSPARPRPAQARKGVAKTPRKAPAKPLEANLVATPPQIDLGDVDPMKVVHFAVKLKNLGKAPVTLKGVGVSCGCTTPNPFESHHDFEPGGEHVVEVDFNPAGLAGQVSRVLHFQSTDPLRPDFNLTFTANVKAVAIPQPEVLVIDGEEGGKASSQPIRFVPTKAGLDPASLKVEDPDAPLKVTYEKALGGEIHGQLTLDPASLKVEAASVAGQQRTRLILTDKSGAQAAMTVVWAVRPAFWVSPAQVEAAAGIGQAFNGYATIVCAKATKVVKVEVSEPGFQAEVTPGDTLNTLRVILRGHGAVKGDLKGTIKVQTDSSVRPVIEIPFLVHVI